MCRRRSGFTLVEVVAAAFIVVAMATMLVQFLAAAGRQRRAADQHQAAMQEAANLMERICAQPFEAIGPDTATRMQLAEHLHAVLPGARLDVEATPSPGDPQVRRIVVTVHSASDDGSPRRPVRLVAWKYGGAEQ